jgi:hypothetical protein
MELGQMARGDEVMQYEANWATEGLYVIADAIAAKRGDANALVQNSGGDEFVCGTFQMRPYCWCEGDVHPEGCPPQFVYGAAGFVLRWYKYAGRGQTANLPKPPGMLWELAVADCIQAVDKWVP